MTMTRTTSLADIVHERLEQDILNGEYRRGDVLTELKLSEHLQVSRTPVREALSRLEQDDLVEYRGKTIVVVGVSPEDLDDILEIRSRLEGIATARCCRHVTEELLTELDELITLQEFYLARNMPEKLTETDSKFHKLIFAASGGRIYEKLLTDLSKKLWRHRQMAVSLTDKARASVGEHREIYMALLNRDEKQAEEAAIRHITNARNRMHEADSAANIE